MLMDTNLIVSVGEGSRYSPQERGEVIESLDRYRLTSAGSQQLFSAGIFSAYQRGDQFYILLPPSSDPVLLGTRGVYRGNHQGVDTVALRNFWAPADGSQDLVLRAKSVRFDDPKRITEQDRTTFDQLLHDLEVKYLRR